MIYQNELRRGLERHFGVETYDQPFSKGRGLSFGISGISEGIKERGFNKVSKSRLLWQGCVVPLWENLIKDNLHGFLKVLSDCFAGLVKLVNHV